MTILRSKPRVKGSWNVIALTETDDDHGTEGRVIERYAYTPYGEFVVINGDSGDGQLGNVLPTSTVGNPFTHQGLPFDHEKGMYQNRWREHAPCLDIYTTRDPLTLRLQEIGGCSGTAHPYAFAYGAPTSEVDPLGLGFELCGIWAAGPARWVKIGAAFDQNPPTYGTCCTCYWRVKKTFRRTCSCWGSNIVWVPITVGPFTIGSYPTFVPYSFLCQDAVTLDDWGNATATRGRAVELSGHGMFCNCPDPTAQPTYLGGFPSSSRRGCCP